MDLGIPGEGDPRRRDVRRWLSEHPTPTGRELAEAGYVVPHWPRPWGLDADPETQLLIDEELRRAGVRLPANPIGIGWAGPTLLYAGSEAQKDRWLWPLLAGEELWCQLFSEPEAGSDLAALRTTAVADGDEWVVRGEKVWTSYAHLATYGILLARTDPSGMKHAGISYFVCPMDAPGVTVRPLVDMTGLHTFNQVLLDDVRLPADHLVGRLHGGWDLARVTLGNERVSLSGEGALWGQGPTAANLCELARSTGGMPDPVLRDRLARVWIEGKILEVLRLRTVSAALVGRQPGPEASVRKALADAHGQHVMDLARDLAGPFGMLAADRRGHTAAVPSAVPAGRGARRSPRWGIDEWYFGFLFSPALTIGGGTSEVQRNIVAERVLGLPRDA